MSTETRSRYPILNVRARKVSTIVINQYAFPVSSGGNLVLTGQTIGTARHDYTGYVGMRFTNSTGATISITELGRWVISGNSKTHTLKIGTFESFIWTELGSVTIDTSGASAGAYLYGVLSSPVSVPDSTRCFILSPEVSGAGEDDFGDSASGTLNTGLTSLVSVYAANPIVTISDNASGQAYCPLNAKYT